MDEGRANFREAMYRGGHLVQMNNVSVAS